LATCACVAGTRKKITRIDRKHFLIAGIIFQDKKSLLITCINFC
jgi:hypothetical protein